MSEKRKLTLSVDSKVIEHAKELNLNISEITEQVLKGFSFEPKADDEEEKLDVYKELFNMMLQPLKKFRGSVEVGYVIFTLKDAKGKEYSEDNTIYLYYDGGFYSDVTDGFIFYIDDLNTKAIEEDHIIFYSPQQLLSNFIDGLVKGSEHQKETIKELEATKKIIEAISSFLFTKIPSHKGNEKVQK